MQVFYSIKNTLFSKQTEKSFVYTPSNLLKSNDMNKHQIGLNAGVIWRLLNNNKQWNYCDLKSASGLSDKDLFAAIGWLAREDKIDFGDEQKKEDCFFLNINVFIG